jgi:hypothetical protein
MTEFMFGEPILPRSHFTYKMILVFSVKAVVLVAPLKAVRPWCYSGSMARCECSAPHYRTLSKSDESCLSMSETLAANRNGLLA